MAMVLGNLQCLGALLLWVIEGLGPAVLAAGAGQGAFLFIFLSILSSLSYTPSFGRQLNMTEILWSRSLDPNGKCQILSGGCLISTD